QGQQHICPVCWKTFKTMRNLKRHVSCTHGYNRQSFECRLCGRSFSRLDVLQRHQQIVLSFQVNDNLRCSICQKTFANLSNHRRHYVSIHCPAKMSFSCVVCGRNYSRKDVLMSHMKKCHYPNISASKSCPICGVRLHSSGLRRHLDSNQEGRFCCPHCSAAFALKWNCQRHIQTVHLKQRNYECPLCKKRFSRIDNMKYHLLCHNGFPTGLSSFPLLPAIPGMDALHEGDGKFSCTRCSAVYKTRYSCLRHIRASHLHQKYACTFCNSRYTRIENLRSHLQLAH
ncbi:hypothetical protein CAPTEDRAFT_64318, partial [Capitella teleta]